MKLFKLLLIGLLIVSCSPDEITEDEPIFVDNCGIIISKVFEASNFNCQYQIRVKSSVNENQTFNRCLEFDEWNDLEEGDTYCYGQIQVN